MDIYESLNSILVTLFNDIMNIEEKALITDEFSDITVTDMHIIEAIGIKEPRTMGTISKALGVTMGTLTDDLSEDEAAVLIKTFTRLEDYFKSIS